MSDSDDDALDMLAALDIGSDEELLGSDEDLLGGLDIDMGSSSGDEGGPSDGGGGGGGVGGDRDGDGGLAGKPPQAMTPAAASGSAPAPAPDRQVKQSVSEVLARMRAQREEARRKMQETIEQTTPTTKSTASPPAILPEQKSEWTAPAAPVPEPAAAIDEGVPPEPELEQGARGGHVTGAAVSSDDDDQEASLEALAELDGGSGDSNSDADDDDDADAADAEEAAEEEGVDQGNRDSSLSATVQEELEPTRQGAATSSGWGSRGGEALGRPSTAASEPKSARSTQENTRGNLSQMCSDYVNTGFCPFGATCRFAHSQSDLMPSMRSPSASSTFMGGDKADLQSAAKSTPSHVVAEPEPETEPISTAIYASAQLAESQAQRQQQEHDRADGRWSVEEVAMLEERVLEVGVPYASLADEDLLALLDDFEDKDEGDLQQQWDSTLADLEALENDSDPEEEENQEENEDEDNEQGKPENAATAAESYLPAHPANDGVHQIAHEAEEGGEDQDQDQDQHQDQHQEDASDEGSLEVRELTELDLLEDLEDLDDFSIGRDETTQRLWALFQEIDVHNVGELDIDQVAQLLQTMGAELTEVELDVAMAEMDVEGTGLIDFEELHTWWLNQGESAFSDRLHAALLSRSKSRKPVILPDLTDPEVRRAGKTMVKVYSRKRLRKNAASYRAEQLANLKSTPDWLARQVGWADAAEMAQAQYESDVLDSKYGMGAGLEWGSERGPLATKDGTLFSPVGRPAKFEDKRALADHMVNHALNSLAVSETYKVLHTVTVAARLKKIVEHNRAKREVEQARQITHAREREAAARKRKRNEESAITYARLLAARRAKMCKGWRLALPKVMLCCRLMIDCRQRMAAKQLERDMAEAVTEELAGIVELLRDTKLSVADKTVRLGSMSLDYAVWEAAPVVRSMEHLGEAFTAGLEAQNEAKRNTILANTSRGKSDAEIRRMFEKLIDKHGGGGNDGTLDKDQVRLLMVELFPNQSDAEFEAAFSEMTYEDEGESRDGASQICTVNFKEFKDWWVREMGRAQKEAAKKMREVQGRLVTGAGADQNEGKADLLALMDLVDHEQVDSNFAIAEAAVIMLAVGANSDRHVRSAATSIMRPRMVAKLLVRHDHVVHFANHLLHTMNSTTCGSAVWDGLLALLSFLVEGFFSVLVHHPQDDAVFDRLYLPSDQKIVIDVLLRQPAHVDYQERRSWMVWLRCVTGIITTSREYRRGESRYRRLDLLDALEHLMKSGSGMGIEQAGMCAGCREVLHNALDEREMQKLLRLEKEKQDHIDALKKSEEQQAAASAAAVKAAEKESQRAAKAEALSRAVRERKSKTKEHEKAKAQQLQAKRAEEEAAEAAAAQLSVDPARLRRATTTTTFESKDDAFTMNLSEPTAGSYDAVARRAEYQVESTIVVGSSGGGVLTAEPVFPAGGLYWSVVGDPAYGEAQPALDFATAQQYATQWDVFRDGHPQLVVFYEGLKSWTPWVQIRHQLGL